LVFNEVDLMKKVLVELSNYPKLENEWLSGSHTLLQIVQSAGIKSFIKVDEMILTYAIDENEFSWFVLKWG